MGSAGAPARFQVKKTVDSCRDLDGTGPPIDVAHKNILHVDDFMSRRHIQSHTFTVGAVKSSSRFGRSPRALSDYTPTRDAPLHTAARDTMALTALVFGLGALLPGATTTSCTRRAAIASAASLSGLCSLGLPAMNAFENGIPAMAQYADREKQPGMPPPDLGLRDRVLPSARRADSVLRACDDAPNCFSTASEGDPAHLLPMWRAPKPASAMRELVDAVKAYPPGQAGVDGGGFEVVKADPNYLYVQYESLKFGFIDGICEHLARARSNARVSTNAKHHLLLAHASHTFWKLTRLPPKLADGSITLVRILHHFADVEFAVGSDGLVQVRSASRLGYLDLGVNAKRLNYLSTKLQAMGWDAPQIDGSTHPTYFRR